MSNSSINEILWTKHELMSASKGKDLTTKFLNNKKNNTGTLIFEYKGVDQLDRLIKIIKENY